MAKKAKKSEKKAKGFIWPVNSKRITQRMAGGHKGVDVGVPIGTRLVAPEGGTITAAGTSSSGYGKYVQIRTASGETIILGHLSQVQVKSGQKVVAGQQVGLSGNTGNSTGPHVHIEVRKGGGYLDPLQLATGGFQVTKEAKTTPKTSTKTTQKGQPPPTQKAEEPDQPSTIETILPEIVPDLEVNWTNVLTGVVGVGLIIIGVLGLVMGETAKMALQPITEPIKGLAEGQA